MNEDKIKPSGLRRYLDVLSFPLALIVAALAALQARSADLSVLEIALAGIFAFGGVKQLLDAVPYKDDRPSAREDLPDGDTESDQRST